MKMYRKQAIEICIFSVGMLKTFIDDTHYKKHRKGRMRATISPKAIILG